MNVAQDLKALAKDGRLVLFGAENALDARDIAAEQVRGLLVNNQAIVNFSLWAVDGVGRDAAFVELMEMISTSVVRVIARPPCSLGYAM